MMKQQLALGVAFTYYFGVLSHFQDIFFQGSWPGLLAKLDLAMVLATTSLFVYVILWMPYIRGIQPDYPNWNKNELQLVVPAMTTSILTGWSLLIFILASYSPLGWLSSFMGGSGFYALLFGLIGMLPTSAKNQGDVKTR